MSDAIIEIKNLHKKFKVGVQDIHVLKGLDLEIAYGDFAVIFGPSGCGKSTFLHIILGLEPPTEGYIKFLGENIYDGTNEDDRADFRKKNIGMVYQQSNWVKSLTVRENVAFPLLLLGNDKPRALSKAYELLRQIHMEQWADYIPTELSGGQQQRVALARALINNPQIIIADEPTGNLDFESGQMIMNLFFDLNKESEKTVIMVTHDLEYLKYAKTAVRMMDGNIVGIYGNDEKEKLMSELKFKRIENIGSNPEDQRDEKPENKIDIKSIVDFDPKATKEDAKAAVTAK